MTALRSAAPIGSRCTWIMDSARASAPFMRSPESDRLTTTIGWNMASTSRPSAAMSDMTESTMKGRSLETISSMSRRIG